MTTVTSAAELKKAIEARETDITVDGTITGSPMITLPEGATLRGGTLRFGAKGVRLSKDNTLIDVTIETQPHETAILNDTRIADAGTLRLQNVTTIGAVDIVAEDDLKALRVEVDGLTIKDADVRGRTHRPHGYGVDVLQGGFTLWNRQADASVVVTATLEGIEVGTPSSPIRGSGVFVAGHGDEEGKADGGTVTVDRLETGTVVTDGGIAPGTADLISGGVFVVSAATVDEVVNSGPVTTHGQNDMALDNWGYVKKWVSKAAVISTGPSGIGFVNFGDIDELEMQGPVTTVGSGARGFNLYDGTLKKATFKEIRTHGDGSIGIQVSKPMGPLVVHGDVATTGGTGTSLVKGVQMELSAIALSVKKGGEVESIEVGGTISTDGDELVTYQVEEGGIVKGLSVAKGIKARGQGSKATEVEGDNPGFDGIEIAEA